MGLHQSHDAQVINEAKTGPSKEHFGCPAVIFERLEKCLPAEGFKDHLLRPQLLRLGVVIFGHRGFSC
ncbi:protein of unknown function (plasmid) [Paraburkholderia dioscoreae]|uniref:Uncharacterized protein n=1 Tax=Paraburkholderia dioscoreae TaxID=2604047 RepID=A0A5Q4ZHZ8_9BURK|nr:protein of unknown function [Paraburkholderia dioscoreae]